MANDFWLGLTADYKSIANWSLGHDPGSSDTGQFGALALTQTITIASGSPVPGGWTFTGGFYTVTVSGVATTVFFEGAGVQVTGGSATIQAVSGGTVTLQGNSDGGDAQFIAAGPTDTIDFSATLGPDGDREVNAGSIAGQGDFFLAANMELTVGSPNFSMVLQGRILGLSGSSLVKDGSGTMTLSGLNVLPGGMTLLKGEVVLDSIGAAGGGGISFGGPATLQIDKAAIGAGHFHSPIVNLPNGASIDLSNFRHVPLSEPFYNPINSTLIVDSDKFLSVIFDHWLEHPAKSAALGNHAGSAALANHAGFAALDDHAGGTEIVAAIIESRPHKLVDAKHHPPGQHSPTNGPDVILALGANDTIKGLGGDDTLVPGATGVALYGGPGADHFVFEKTKVSPPAPGLSDTIWKFSHAQHDKIDLYDLFHAVHNQPLVFIGHQTFAQYHDDPHHKMVFGMVRYAGGVVEVNVNHNLAPDLAIKVHGTPVHESDLIL